MASDKQSPQHDDGPRLASVEAIVRNGRAVLSADDATVVAAVKDAVVRGRVATFYVSHAQSNIVMRWYWTPERIKAFQMEAVSAEEKARIESELGVKDTGHLYSNRIDCDCGQEYGAFEFVQQGIREHGREMVGAVLEFEDTSVIRVNPPTIAICPGCDRKLLAGHYYCWVNGYMCCQSVDHGGPIVAV